MSNKSLVSFIEGTICAALAIVLSFIKIKFGFVSISLGMIPITLYAIRRGPVKGMFAGLLWGVLHILVARVEFQTLLQGFLEYFVAYTFTGVAGLLSPAITRSIRRENDKQAKYQIFMAVFLGTVARYVWHFIAGVVFWGKYAPEGMNPVVYSLLVNGLSALLTAVVTTAVLLFIQVSAQRLFVPERVSYK